MSEKIITTPTVEQFKKILPLICNWETSADPKEWTSKNPLWGHCAVVSLIAQNLFGGELVRASLRGTPFEESGSHYWNKLLDGEESDFTEEQFGGKLGIELVGEPRTREYVLYDPKTHEPREIMQRYKTLAYRLVGKLYSHQNGGVTSSPIYRECFMAAIESPCQKMKMGCLVIHKTRFVYSCYNKTLEPLARLCDPTCIRLQIQSRTDPMIGACGHAEELALWPVNRMGTPINECDLYIIGLYPTGLPWFRKEPEFTCLRCAVQMYNAGVRSVSFPYKSSWMTVSAKEALETALKYAVGERWV